MSRTTKKKNLKKSDIHRRFSILVALYTLGTITSAGLFFVVEKPYLAAGIATSGLATSILGLKKSYQNYQHVMLKKIR